MLKNGTRIVSAKIENVQRIGLAELTFDENGGLCILAGDNGAGKSSILDGIWYGLAGGRGDKRMEKPPIKKGEATARVTITLSGGKLDGLTVTRSWTEKSDQLTIKDTRGFKANTPQELLNEVFGVLSVDPLRFKNANKKQRYDMLVELVDLGFNMEVMKEKRKALFEERTSINRELKNKEGELVGLEAGLPENWQQLPGEELKLSDLIGQQNAAIEDKKKNDIVREQLKDRQRSIENTSGVISEIEESIKRLQADLEYAMQKKALDKKAASTLEAKIAMLKDPDIEAIKQKMVNAETTNQNIRAVKKYKETSATVSGLRKQSDGLTVQMEKMDRDKEDGIKKATFPIPGLSIADEDVIYNGIPYDNLSEGEKFITALSIAIAQEPELRFIRANEGSLLDKNNLEVMHQLGIAKGYTFITQRVGAPSGSEPGTVLIIEDGVIKQ